MSRKTGFVRWAYAPEQGQLLSNYVNTFIRKAIGFQIADRWFFGLLIADPLLRDVRAKVEAREAATPSAKDQ